MSATIDQYAQIIQKLVEKQNFFEKALLNSRVRKAIDYNHHYRPEIRAPLEPGDIVLVEPEASFGAFEVRADQIPEVVPPQKINILASDFSKNLGALSASPGSQQKQITELDLDIDEIGIYKILPEDFGYVIQLNQPTTITRFTNKLGSWNLSGADIMPLFENHYQGLIPEVMVFEDRTPITIKAISTDPNTSANYYVRVRVYGYKFPIKKMPKETTIKRGDPRIVANIWVGNPYK